MSYAGTLTVTTKTFSYMSQSQNHILMLLSARTYVHTFFFFFSDRSREENAGSGRTFCCFSCRPRPRPAPRTPGRLQETARAGTGLFWGVLTRAPPLLFRSSFLRASIADLSHASVAIALVREYPACTLPPLMVAHRPRMPVWFPMGSRRWDGWDCC